MKKNILGKQMLDIFSERLNSDFIHYCEKHKQDKDSVHFITYLVDHNLISKATIRQYTIVASFNDLFPNSNHRKTQIVELLAHRFNVTPRSIWNILRKKERVNREVP